MIVVSDTGPIHYLVLIGHDGLLAILFGLVLIPPSVLEELTDDGAPDVIRAWTVPLPSWVIVREPSNFDLGGPERGKGERAAIALAKELRTPILSDDRAARQIARGEGLIVSGTLGVLIEAHARELLSIGEALDDLSKTNFFLTESLVERTRNLAEQLKLSREKSSS